MDRRFATVRERYAQPSEIRKYASRSGDGFLEWERTVAEKYLAPPGSLLDIGCGGGRESIAFALRGYVVTAIDINEELLGTARSVALSLDVTVDFRLCDGTTLDFLDASFDCAVLFSQVLGNVPGGAGRAALLREVRRVLRPGGRFAFSVHNRDVCEPVARAKGLIVESTELPMEEGDCILVEDAGAVPCYWHYFTRDEILALCGGADLEVLECRLAQDFGQTDWDTVWVCVCRA